MPKYFNKFLIIAKQKVFKKMFKCLGINFAYKVKEILQTLFGNPKDKTEVLKNWEYMKQILMIPLKSIKAKARELLEYAMEKTRPTLNTVGEKSQVLCFKLLTFSR